MAEVIGGIGISHSPSMGVEYDKANGTRENFDDRWGAWYDGCAGVRELLARLDPSHLVVVYNDHLNYFDLDNYPTLAIGVGDGFRQADEGFGLRDLPDLPGDASWGIHLTEHLVANDFDMTVSQDLAIDHGIFSWLPYVSDPAWPVPLTPIAVNMIRQPLPTQRRLRDLGLALRAGIEAMPTDDRVLVIATGGMSHQISGGRFGLANARLDRRFLETLPTELDALVALPREEYVRYGGTEAAELSLWFTMRAALSERARSLYSFHTVPQITGCGALVMAEPGVLERIDPPMEEQTS